MVSFTKKNIKTFIFFCFFLVGVWPNLFERFFFFNELLSLLGIYLFLKNYAKPKHSKLYKLTIWFLVLCIIQMIRSIPIMTNLYFFLRNSVIFYSAFTFFIGYFWFEDAVKFFKSYRKALSFLAFLVIIIPLLDVFDRFNLSTFIPVFFSVSSGLTIFLIALINIIYGIQYDALTVLVNTFLLIIIILSKSTKQITLFFLMSIFIFATLFISFSDEIQGYKLEGAKNFMGNVAQVEQSNPIFSLDPNTTWRIIFWYRVLIERFPENLVGFGFGTPLLTDYIPGDSTQQGRAEYDDEYVAHVIGAHNTYITLFARLGILYIPLFLMTYFEVFKNYFKTKKRGIHSLYYWCFFTISVIGLFNLVLETPTVASLYWVFLGFVAKITNNYKLTNSNLI